MIVTRTPLRIGLLGGGSDFEAFIDKHGYGKVLNGTINKYVYVLVRKRYDDLIYLKYSENEIVSSIEDIKHDFIRETLKFLDIDFGIEIVNFADLPTAGTGTGSSSSFLVGLLLALHTLKGESVSKKQLAEEACHIEINLCGKPIGYQDQYAAAFGGLNIFTFRSMTDVDIRKFDYIDSKTSRHLSDNMIMWYTGISRESQSILSDQVKNYDNKEVLDNMVKNIELVEQSVELLENKSFFDIGFLLNKNWQLKKTFSFGITNDIIDGMLSAALKSGAVGGKITGAGGGGFLVLFAKENNRASVISRLNYYTENNKASKEMKFNFDPYGSRILINVEEDRW